MNKDEKDKNEVKQGDNSPAKYHARIGKEIGSGVMGNVYELEGENGSPLLMDNKEWVVKTPLHVDEAKFTARYRATFIKDDRYLITEKIKGIPLSVCRLGFLDSLKVVNLIAQTLNRFHHRTLNGGAILHNDLNSDNVLIARNNKNEVTDVNIIDFGCAIDISDENPASVQADWGLIIGPPQAAFENRYRFPYFPAYIGIKSDIYQAGRLFSNTLLGIWNYDNPIKDININIMNLVFNFLDLMKESEYAKRPDSDQMLLFFHSLYRMYAIHKVDPENKDTKNKDIKIIMIVKLILLSNGMWDEKIIIEEKLYSKFIRWNQFDFESEANIHACRAILNIAKYTVLSGNIENIIVYNKDISEKVASPSSQSEIIEHLADKFGLNFLCHIKGNLEQRREISKVAILYLLNRAKNKTEVKDIIEKLESLANKNKIDFLYKRQGYFFTFSYHNRKWKGEKVSGTWLEIMALAKARENILPEEKVFLRSRL